MSSLIWASSILGGGRLQQWSLSPPSVVSRRRRAGLPNADDLVSVSTAASSLGQGTCYQRCVYSSRNTCGQVFYNQVNVENVVDDEACELVSGVEVVIGEDPDSIRAYLLKAIKNNNETGVLILSDVFGFEDSSTRDFAYRVACSGYNVLIPDLFRGNPWKKGRPLPEYEHWLTEQSLEKVTNDIDMTVKWLIDEFEAAGLSKKLGIVGLSYGGERLIETLARDKSANFSTGVSFYGATRNASLAKDVKVPVLLICGENDTECPVSELHNIEKTIRGSRLVTYPGRGHGFAHRPESLDEDEDAEKAFSVMRNWLHDKLLGSKKSVT